MEIYIIIEGFGEHNNLNLEFKFGDLNQMFGDI